jgi:hypothetical protein
MWPIIKMGLRVCVWKPTENPPLVGLSTVLPFIVVEMLVAVLVELLGAGGAAGWSMYGLNSLMASTALWVLVIAFFFRSEVLLTAICASVTVSVILSFLSVLYRLGLMLPPVVPSYVSWMLTALLWMIFVSLWVWWIGALVAIFRSFGTGTLRRHFVQACGLALATIVIGMALPSEPIFRGPNFDPRSANWWEYLRATAFAEKEEVPAKAETNRALVERSQPALFDFAKAGLAPQRPGVTDVYAIGVAGWADQDVFRKELDGAVESLARSFGVKDRVIKLVNNPQTVSESPIATRQNFAAAIRAVAQVMDKEEDILLLFLTSHGDKRGVALHFRGLVYSELTPEDVAAVLADAGIVNRIVVVSACYSGVFIEPLANFNTIVLTAADAEHTSFGCSNEREWTYFGDAFFNQSLVPGRDIEAAFGNAQKLISEWEERDKLPASNPQAHFGVMLKEKLATVYDFARSAEQHDKATGPIVDAVPQ